MASPEVFLPDQRARLSHCGRPGTCYRGDAVKYIGGYLELELPRGHGSWHPDAIALNTGRACMATILRHVRPRTVRMPFYTCDALIAPVLEAGIGLEFYHLDKQL